MTFAPCASDERYREQERLLAHEDAGSEDRDLLLMRFLEDGTETAAGERIPAGAVASARLEHGAEDGRFTAALVGRAGGVQFRADAPVPAREIRGRIDAMPMRRREMRGRACGSK